VDLKKKRVDYPSVMHFEGRLASGLDDICNLFADFIQRTYAESIEEGCQVDSVYTDFSKAFDRVCRQLLLLDGYG
jgi:hypothetical protein